MDMGTREILGGLGGKRLPGPDLCKSGAPKEVGYRNWLSLLPPNPPGHCRATGERGPIHGVARCGLQTRYGLSLAGCH